VDVGRDAFVAIYDLAGKTAMRPLTIRGNNRFPVWTSDSKRVAYQSDREGDLAIFWQAADGSGTVERLTKPNSGEAHIPEAWAPSSDTLLFSALKGFEYTLWTLSLPEKTIAAFDSVRSNGVPTNSTFSPDGRWVAYQTNQDRRTTIYVQPMPPTGAVYQLLPRAADIPHEPVWSPDGKQLFYNPRAGGFESVSVTTLPEFAFGNPVPLPRVFQMSPPQARRSYDITRDGKFVGLILPGSTDPAAGSHIEFVVNWFDELKRRVSSPQ
jgi:Tol biopolymer transport system component